MKPPRLTEEALQEIVAAWLDLTGWLWWHTPNGGKRNKVVAAKMKRAGQKPGVPDILIFEPWASDLQSWSGRNGFQVTDYAKVGHGLAIELKAKGNYPTKLQKECMAALEARGWRTAVCRSLEEVQKACECLRPINGRQAPY
jgi:hypothetical protein